MGASARHRIEALRDEIRRHDHAYYTLGQPVISDREYDHRFEELQRLEAQHPELITPDAPTQRVGERPIEGFASVTHAVPMLSVDNTYDEHQLREFDRRVARGLGGESYRYVVDPKIDGVAVSLTYDRGRLALAATRGDGTTGDDITHAARTIAAIPLRLLTEVVPSLLEVRGEIVWPIEAFRRFNAQREAAGEPPFANPRNATTGTLKQLDPRNVAGRGLLFIAHGFGRVEPLPANTDWELFARFRCWGIPISPVRERLDSIDAIVQRLGEWDARRRSLPYETDGLVIKVDALDQRDALGATSRYPRWCIAYKFAAEQAQSVLLKVDFQVGKLGTITPRAVMEPVLLSGTTVRHASLHNFDQIDRLDVRIGDTVIVEKAGEIIPQVVTVVREKRPKNAKKIDRPQSCPVCHGEVAQDEGGVYVRCVNAACPAQLKERLSFFCARDQMDIEGLGQVIIEKMVDKGWLRSCADIYEKLPEMEKDIAAIDIEQERTKDGKKQTSVVTFGEKRARKLLEGINRSKKQPLARLLAGLNIRHVGASTAEDLAEHFQTMDALIEAAAEESSLTQVEGVGSEVAKSIQAFFHERKNKDLIKRLKDACVNMQQPKRKVLRDSPLAGKSVVITGTLESLGRKEAQDLVKQLGGTPTGSVSKKTDMLVCGESPGSKLDKARELGIPVLDEAAFLKLVGR